MYPRKIEFKLRIVGLIVLAVASAAAQTPDTQGNGLLNGSFRFRHVAIQNVDENYNPTEITAIFGSVTFDGAGHYTVAATSIDNTVSGGAPQLLNVSGTYAIGSNGIGFLTNPLYPADDNAYIYGAVAQGTFTGSSTESYGDGDILNDIFIAIPVGSPPANASFTTPYQTGLLDFTGAGSTAIKNALFELTPNGQGGFGTITLNGQAANLNSSTVTQSITGATYNFNSDGSATLSIPPPSGVSSSNALFTGSKTIFQSANGNFILGWTEGGYDIFFGVAALTVAGTNNLSTGLYFTSALEDTPDGEGTDSYYGGTNNTGDSAGDGVVHQRINLPLALSYDYGTDDQIDVTANGTTGTDFNGYDYIFGAGGQAFVGIGTNGFFSLIIGMHAPAFSGPGVYLNPIGVTNAASFQPVTASIAPGELLLLTGTGLSTESLSMQGGQPFPTTLGGVTVSIDGSLCPIFYVSSTAIAAIVPYEVASNQSGLANIQVTSNQTPSNVVQVYLTDAAPGSFSETENGIGLAAAEHGNGELITSSNPAQPGEYISMFLTGLGPVTPTITDGAVGPSNPLSWADVYKAGNLSVVFNELGSANNPGTIEYAGLVPTLAGLYQLNVQVPTSGLGEGDDVYVEFVSDAAISNQIQIPYGSAGGGRSVTPALRRTRAALIKEIRSRPRSFTRRIKRASIAQ